MTVLIMYIGLTGNGTVSTEQACQRHCGYRGKRQAHELASAFFRPRVPNASSCTQVHNLTVDMPKDLCVSLFV